MTSTATTTAKPLGIGCYADFPVAGTNLTVAVVRTADVAYTVFVVATDNGVSRRVEGHTRDFSAISHGLDYRAAADTYRQHLLNELAPAAPVVEISEATFDATAARAARDLPEPQQRALAAANGSYIARGNGISESTLRAMDRKNIGVLVRDGYRVAGLRLTNWGRQMQAHILTHRTTIAA